MSSRATDAQITLRTGRRSGIRSGPPVPRTPPSIVPRGLEAVFGRAKQLSNADPELEEALQIVDRLIQTVEQAEHDPHRAHLLAEDVLRLIGVTAVTYLFADDVRGYLIHKGFMGLESKLSNEEIAGGRAPE